MNLKKDAVKEFQKIYKQEYGKAISFREARFLGTNLLHLMKVVYKPMKIDINENGKK